MTGVGGGEGERDRLHPVGGAGELEPGDRLLVEVDGREVAVFVADGAFHAVANYCTHQGGPVCE